MCIRDRPSGFRDGYECLSHIAGMRPIRTLPNTSSSSIDIIIRPCKHKIKKPRSVISYVIFYCSLFKFMSNYKILLYSKM